MDKYLKNEASLVLLLRKQLVKKIWRVNGIVHFTKLLSHNRLIKVCAYRKIRTVPSWIQNPVPCSFS